MYGFRTQLKGPFDTAVTKVTEALKKEESPMGTMKVAFEHSFNERHVLAISQAVFAVIENDAASMVRIFSASRLCGRLGTAVAFRAE